MTLRGGGRPRDRGPQAHPLDGSDALPPARRAPGPVPTRDERTGRRGGSPVRPFLVLGAGAIVVLAVLWLVVWPVLTGAIGDWAVGNPSTWRLPLLGDIVAQRLAPALAEKASEDPGPVDWVVVPGDTVATVADRLVADGLVRSRPAFLYAAMEQDLGSKLVAGTFRLDHDMTPPQVVTALIEARVVIPTLDVTFREGLRLEQLVAKLETIQSAVDPKTFYDLATHPPASLLNDYPWLKLPAGATLEGYLYPATYTIRTDKTTADDLIRMMLDAFYKRVGADRLQVPASRGLTFAQVLALASIVEQEAKLDEERPLIAGVYQNRLSTRPFLLNADPTVIYAVDSAQLASLPIDQWKTYSFWNLPPAAMAKVQVPSALAGYQTYVHPGLIPGPISSPTVASIDAALQPDTADKYLYFVLIPNSGGKHAFARTYAEHLANLKKYGYL
ncbi:MAG TPA: endolytic transglycosylase MltG [Candidatus Dormibacteraeota bacterium]|nr:endolytic transglycosylase MltG [Candidatus Dormibacteraeota bacterium]